MLTWNDLTKDAETVANVISEIEHGEFSKRFDIIVAHIIADLQAKLPDNKPIEKPVETTTPLLAPVVETPTTPAATETPVKTTW